MFSFKCETFVLQVTYAWVAELFSKWGEQVHDKKFRTFLRFELSTVTPQALNYDVIKFCQHSNFVQNLIRPQRPYLRNTLSIIHYTVLST